MTAFLALTLISISSCAWLYVYCVDLKGKINQLERIIEIKELEYEILKKKVRKK